MKASTLSQKNRSWKDKFRLFALRFIEVVTKDLQNAVDETKCIIKFELRMPCPRL